MKQFSLTGMFYIIFVLLLFYPAHWISSEISNLINKVPVFSQITLIGIVEVPTTVAILYLFFCIINNFIWKITLVGKLIDIPNINGRYEGSLISSYNHNENEGARYPVVLEIKQTLTSIWVNLYTQRSCSYSLIASLCTNNNSNQELVYVYQNKTSAMKHNSDMQDHVGTAFLEIFEKGSELRGYYFNNPRDRGRYGEIRVTRVKSNFQGRF